MADETGRADVVLVERVVDAPREVVWQLWTEPEHVAAWYGPNGASVPDIAMDVRVGGSRRLCMQVETPGGPHRMWFVGEFRLVEPPELLVFTEAMADEHGNVLSPADAGFPVDHPTLTTVTVRLEDADGRTRVVLTHAGIPSDSPAAAGWTMALDKLASLAEARRRTS